MKKPMIPFGVLPGHWGLRGKTRDIAKAEYELSGYDLERRLIELEKSGKDYDKAINDLDLEHGKISQEEHAARHIDLLPESKDKKLAVIDHDFKYKKITQLDREKLRADVLDEPWVNIISIGLDDTDPSKGSFELDWNDKFVEQLRDAGYQGAADEQVIDEWVNTLCKNIAMEEFNGHGSMDGIAYEDGMLKRTKIDDDRWEVK